MNSSINNISKIHGFCWIDWHVLMWTSIYLKVEYARAATKLYFTHRKEWEKCIKNKFKKTKIKSNKSSWHADV
jgi:hypothetical protein